MSSELLPTLFWLAPVGAALALAIAYWMYMWIKRQPQGNERMVQISGWVKEGALSYLKSQYKTVGWFFLGAFVLFSIASFSFHVLNPWVPLAFLTGGFFVRLISSKISDLVLGYLLNFCCNFFAYKLSNV